MIATMTANPCLDKTVAVEKFDLYRMNRVEILRTDFSGKGINVSRVLKAFGGETLCTGFDFCDSGTSLLTEDLDLSGIAHDFVTVKGALRVCTKIFDETRKHTIEVNERGVPVTAADGERLLAKVENVAKRCDFFTLSGSLPMGLDRDFYAECVRRIKAAAPGCRVVVDAEGEQLLSALQAAPFMIKPNIYEFEGTFGVKAESLSDLDHKAREILEAYGLGMICVSLGEKGAYIADRSGAYFSEPAAVTVRSLQGAGDSMVAGICLALEQGLSTSDVLHYGVAAAGATVSTEGTQAGRRADFEELLNRESHVRKIS
ncbi:MAG: 1-phosphofructokinase family hexose kinase [Clostridia bacterium]|nr:1-phosphofructokinase family hexose kinase [Clostridia bacterium]